MDGACEQEMAKGPQQVLRALLRIQAHMALVYERACGMPSQGRAPCAPAPSGERMRAEEAALM